VHIATHGFFARSAPPPDAMELFASVGRVREPWTELVGQTRNPLAESGLALAGANRPPLPTGETSGILTAEELIGLDLHGTRLVTLSACETGRGEEATGQGVLGLRAAFLAAGARTLVMSLWKVPDEATRELMHRFYQNLWERQLPPLPALLAAQDALRSDPSGAFTAPANWAGWILVGEGW
jgi:CHAT domain-containing protein